MGGLYQRDRLAWADEQIAALAKLRDEPAVGALDVEHLTEELDELRQSVARELMPRLAVLLAHLAQWRWQPERRSPSWLATIGEQRDPLALLLEEHPSARAAERLERAWRDARRKAARETGFPADTFPAPCPVTLDPALQDDWLPG